MYLEVNSLADTMVVSDKSCRWYIVVLRGVKRDEDGDISGSDGDTGCCSGMWMVMKFRRGGGESKDMMVIKVGEIRRSHAKFLDGDGFKWWLDVDVFSGELTSWELGRRTNLYSGVIIFNPHTPSDPPCIY